MRFPTRRAAASYSAHCRWRAAEVRAQAERDAGIPDREPISDLRDALELDLRTHGGPRLLIEPRVGYVAVRVLDADSGRLIECAALKTALHNIAARLPRRLGLRNLE